MTTSVGSSLAEWLASSNPLLLNLLSQCSFDIKNGRLRICHPDSTHLNQILDELERIEIPSGGTLIQSITLAEGMAPESAQIIGQLSTEVAAHYQKPPPVDTFGFATLAPHWSNPVAVIDNLTHLALLGSQACADNARATTFRQWQEADHSLYHYPEELARYLAALDEHRIIRGFEYRALDFNREPLLMTVNACVGLWGTRSVRIVETLAAHPG